MKDLRVLVVDDSALNRRTLSELVTQRPGAQVVGTAADGDEALKMASMLEPDLITLDLEMPRMDGFTFLRLLMANRPTPVVVVSSHAGKENVFRALELGAIDFITKPDQLLSGDTEGVKQQLDRMIAVVRQLSPASVGAAQMPSQPPPAQGKVPARPAADHVPRRVVVIAASTGGPTALMRLFSRLPAHARGAVVVAQHMPERFTTTFAERLDRQSAFRVREAEHLHELRAGTALVCPGGRCLEIARRDDTLVARVVFPGRDDRYAPSADRLMASAAKVMGEGVMAVVLTGMGDDAGKGVVAVKEAGGVVLAEAEDTAVVYGMPQVAMKTGCVDEMLPLDRLIDRVVEALT
ncbi:MAG: chemotaxis-specific protein-glutamate methyltransferase CheB [Myxococcales bacterium]